MARTPDDRQFGDYRVPLELLGQVALALIPMISVPKNDSATFDEIVAEIDGYAGGRDG